MRHKFQSSKKNIQGTHQPLIRVARKNRGSNDESSYSKHEIRVTQVSIIKEKHSRYTPPTNQG